MRLKFTSYIQNLSMPDNFKSVVLDANFTAGNPIYYQKYPELFAQVFLVESKNLELLNIAGYLYYQATLFTDTLIDEKDLSKFPLVTVCQEESIKILTSIYGLENSFWQLWNARRNEYFEAIYLEKSFLEKEVITIEEYEILADKKSAFGKVAIDCLFSIDNSKDIDLYEQLLLSHKYFSVAFQLNDDIQDLKADVKKGQFNWAFYLLKQNKMSDHAPEKLEKYIHIRGISKQMYQLGIFYCDKALELVKDIDVHEWKKVLYDTKKAFITFIIEIDNYLEILTADITLVSQKIAENNTQNSISSAITYIKKKQQENGSWREYVNQGGISTTWASAFILSKISENKILQRSFENEIPKAISFLENNHKDVLWSYNGTWIEDSDSANFALLSYFLNNKEIDTDIAAYWLNFQNSDGGFSTYYDENKLLTSLDDRVISKVSGWIHSHDCVSAVSFYFLAKINQQSEAFIKLKKYFEAKTEQELNSYWWTSNIYVFYYLAKTYHLLGEKQQLSLILDKVKREQAENGSFGDKYGENLFYTGLALEILLLENNENEAEIEKTIEYLFKNQYQDGSWDNSHALQVPDSSKIKPENTPYPVATFGMNVRAKEFNRLFTTTVILQALSIYEQKYSTATV
jgi:hypothetical protein